MIENTNVNIEDNVVSLPEVKKSTITRQMIGQIVKVALKELAVSLIFAAITIPFITTPFGVGMLFVSMGTMIVFNSILRAKYAHTCYKANQVEKGTKERADLLEKVEVWKLITDYICPINFSFFDLSTREVVVHEAGHAIAASILYKGANPRIAVDFNKPFWPKGLTTWSDGNLSAEGSRIGAKASESVCMAAGTGATFLVSLASIIVSHKIRNKHPRMSKYLLTTAICSIANSIFYAVSAFCASSRGHDFFKLWVNGIHPAVFIVSLVVIPIIVKLGMLLYDKYKEKKAKSLEEVAKSPKIQEIPVPASLDKALSPQT